MSAVNETDRAKPTSPFTVGQKVIVGHGRYDNPLEGVVVKIARRWMTVELDPHGRQERFDAITGAEDAGQYTPRSFARTPEMLAEQNERADLAQRLKAAGLRFEFGGYEARCSTEKLRRLVAVAEEPS